jgi:hypothetical protein
MHRYRSKDRKVIGANTRANRCEVDWRDLLPAVRGVARCRA